MSVIEARRAGFWRGSYELAVDGRQVVTWDPRVWRAGGSFELDGVRHEVTSNAWGTRWQLTRPPGAVVAVADGVGRRQWTVEAEGRSYAFRRPSWWRSEERLVAGGRDVGSIRRKGAFTSDAVADLPGLPLPVQVFVLAVVLYKWDAAAAAAAAS